jgi:hypothetical protein
MVRSGLAMLPSSKDACECEVGPSSCGMRLPSVRAAKLVICRSIVQAPG